MKWPKFSVVMSVYEKDNAEWFDIALNSVIKQTVSPSEIVLVVDGPVPLTIENVIAKYKENSEISLRVVKLIENNGLGNALKIAVENCNNELVARMDSDDIAVPDRFEKQLLLFINDDELSICGGQIEEFIDTMTNIVGKRIVPLSDAELKEFMKIRCPFNHVTVMFRKTDVLRVGNYQDWFWNEDYYLWIRMALANLKFGNIDKVLVHVRVGREMYARRGGEKYYQSEVALQKFMLNSGIINYQTYLSNCAKRFIVQKLLPNSMRAWFFKIFARN